MGIFMATIARSMLQFVLALLVIGSVLFALSLRRFRKSIGQMA